MVLGPLGDGVGNGRLWGDERAIVFCVLIL
jgi:hypothetical protein